MNKTAAKWNRKLANRTTRKESRRNASGDFEARLVAPTLASGGAVTGSNKERHRKENKRKRISMQEHQPRVSYWKTHEGQYTVPTPKAARPTHKGSMCPAGLATLHPAGDLLLDYAMKGCPANTGRPWTLEEMEAAVEKGPHVSALQPEAMAQLQQEVAEKEKQGAVRVVLWEDLKKDLPRELKVSPIAMIPHKSRLYRAILDLSYKLRLTPDEVMKSVNESTTKTAPRGAIDQLGHSLSRIIHAFAEVDDDVKVFIAKWDIKDGFWRLDCEEGEEYNIAYVLPQEEGMPVKLVIPTSLQMGWIEPPPVLWGSFRDWQGRG